MAASVRSRCGSERGTPECNSQRPLAVALHSGNGTSNNFLGLSSFPGSVRAWPLHLHVVPSAGEKHSRATGVMSAHSCRNESRSELGNLGVLAALCHSLRVGPGAASNCRRREIEHTHLPHWRHCAPTGDLTLRKLRWSSRNLLTIGRRN